MGSQTLPRGGGPECSYGGETGQERLLNNKTGILEKAVLAATQRRNYSKESNTHSGIENFGVLKYLSWK